MKILMTGSRGFVGASFGNFASAAGHEVLASAPEGDFVAAPVSKLHAAEI